MNFEVINYFNRSYTIISMPSVKNNKRSNIQIIIFLKKINYNCNKNENKI